MSPGITVRLGSARTTDSCTTSAHPTRTRFAQEAALLDLQGPRIVVLDAASDRVQRSDAWVSQPREHELRRNAGSDHLVVDHVGGHPAQREIPPLLADDLVAGGEADQVGEPL